MDDSAEVTSRLDHLITNMVGKPHFHSIPAKEHALRVLKHRATTQSFIVMAEAQVYDSYVAAHNFALQCKVRDEGYSSHAVTFTAPIDDMVMRVPPVGLGQVAAKAVTQEVPSPNAITTSDGSSSGTSAESAMDF